MKILVINGPNLNLLGKREPEIYGSETLADIDGAVIAAASDMGVEVDTYQSNEEGLLVTEIGSAVGNYDGIIINPGALTHYSIAIRDAIKSFTIPTVEVHLSDINTREDFRKVSVIKDICIEQIKGLGAEGYKKAMVLLAGKKKG